MRTSEPMLILSLYPGADLFGMAFEEAGCVVVRGPDVLLGGDARRFRGTPRFDGIIGGPPCQPHSPATEGNTPKHECGIENFARIVRECRSPKTGVDPWWVMEQVPAAPEPQGVGCVTRLKLDAWDFGARQRRRRVFYSNLPLIPEPVALPECQAPLPTVMATEHKYSSGDKRRAGRALGRRMTLAEVNVAMGLPEDWATPALKVSAAYEVRGNGVPLPMGRAIAKAVIAALSPPSPA